MPKKEWDPRKSEESQAVDNQAFGRREKCKRNENSEPPPVWTLGRSRVGCLLDAVKVANAVRSRVCVERVKRFHKSLQFLRVSRTEVLDSLDARPLDVRLLKIGTIERQRTT